MGLFSKLVGTPQEHQQEKDQHEVVTTPEFDITQYAKKLGVVVTALAAAAVAALKGFDVKQTEGIVIAIFGVIGAALLGTCLVMATDLASRAYLAGPAAAKKGVKKKGGNGDDAENGNGDPPPDTAVVAAPAGTMVWLEGEDGPSPVLALAGDGEKTSSYLVAAGSTVKRPSGGEGVKAIDGAPKWRAADDVRAVKTTKWP